MNTVAHQLVAPITSGKVAPAIAGTAVTAGSTAVAWFAHTLPIVQWVAAAVGIVVGLYTLYWTIRQHVKDKS
jgi:hypothetical protein